MRSDKRKAGTKEYWEKNIGGFAGFYDKKSEEDFKAPFLIKHLYKLLVLPIEKKYMRDRYEMICGFIEQNVEPGMKVADIGCGSGIHTKLMANKCKKVYAIDYAQSAIDLTANSLSPEEMQRVEIMKLDITLDHIPDVDIAISIGVLPYINELDSFFGNILPYTKRFLFNYLDITNFFNRFRRNFPILDVRHYSYYDSKAISNGLKEKGFAVNELHRLATGFVIDAIRS